MAVRILIADDHEIVRKGIVTLISSSRPGWEICGEASSGQQAIDAVRGLKPDVVVLDIGMPGLNGLQAAAKIADLNLNCRVLIFTMHESARLPAEIRKAGAHGYVMKSLASQNLLVAIDRLLAGGTFFEETPPAGSAG